MSEKDHVFGEDDYQKRQAAAAEWCKTHPDPRHKYVAHYNYNGTERSEEVWERNPKAALEYIRSEWAKIGVILSNLEIRDN